MSAETSSVGFFALFLIQARLLTNEFHHFGPCHENFFE
jgi:hypothetical protein